MARLQAYFREKVVPDLMKQFGYKTMMQVPRISKITLNMGVGETTMDKKILDKDPFSTIDTIGVGSLVRIAVEKGRATRPDIKLGICGEHGGDPATIEFCASIGQNYVSCSPFRVPIARLAAAHATLKN